MKVKVNPGKFRLLLSDRISRLVHVCYENISSTCSEKLFTVKIDKAYF